MFRSALAGFLIPLAVVLSFSGSAEAAEEPSDPAKEACLSNIAGSVPAGQETDGDDLVCIGKDDIRIASLGDDVYFWTVEPVDGVLGVLRSNSREGQENDPGYDALSLETWSQPYTEDQYGSLAGTHFVGASVEEYRYTNYDDQFGVYTEDCAPVSDDTTFKTLEGADSVECVAGNIETGDDGDTVVGVPDDSTVITGEGDDTVVGDVTADNLDLGAGDDTAYLSEDSATPAPQSRLSMRVAAVSDFVDGGTGFDTVYLDPSATSVNVERLIYPETTPPVVTPTTPPVVTPPVVVTPTTPVVVSKPVPAKVKGVKAKRQGKSVKVSWKKVSGAAKYQIKCGSVKKTAKKTSIVFKVKAQTCKVRAKNSSGYGKWSNQVRVR